MRDLKAGVFTSRVTYAAVEWSDLFRMGDYKKCAAKSSSYSGYASVPKFICIVASESSIDFQLHKRRELYSARKNKHPASESELEI
ncbi:hypothetical protein HZH68_013960 [Vespula germanica]|uniref:Uncharacterized protein n=1 Tax=Vespula germanica TaxID=30212 RepID=A0A834MUD2_VESGE|nr:hypothetical protein HZH68_013960 [Vespula germanica]